MVHEFPVELIIDMSYLEDLKALEWELVHSNKEIASVEDLARAVARTASSIDKASSPTEDERIFGLEWLILFMNKKENYDILKFISSKTMHLPPVKVPNFKMAHIDEKKLQISFKKASDEAVTDLMEFMLERNWTNYKKLVKSCNQLIKQCLTAIFHSKRMAANPGQEILL